MIALLLAQALAAQSSAPLRSVTELLNPTRDLVQVKETAYGLLPPNLVTEGDVLQMQWSSDGSTLAFVKRSATPALNQNLEIENLEAAQREVVCEWSYADPRVKELFTVDGRKTSIAQMEWLHDSDVLLVTTTFHPENGSPMNTVYRIRPLSDPQQLFTNAGPIYLEPSEKQDLALIERELEPGAPSAYLAEEDGTKLVPVEPHDPHQFYGFDKSGWPCTIEALRDPVTNKRLKTVSQRIDLQSGAFKVSAQAEYEGPAEPDKEFSVSDGGTTAIGNAGKSVRGRSQWIDGSLKSPFPAALISVDTESAALSPARNAVSYSSQGCLFVRKIIKLDAAMAKAMADELAKELALSQAKQVALGMLMYANDYNDNFPNSFGWASALGPYLKSDDLASGFTYSYSGSTNVTSIAEPASTILGYVQTATGRAVAYTDGHVRWLPGP
ncbi:MAG TPA: hypothetical protein VGL56_03680 [Fimbriimonadaceae bacterium]|jgi:hypothetical protein